MPVIGRLDDQVEAVLINPLKRPTTPGTETRDEAKSAAVPGEDRAPESLPDSPRERHSEEAAELPVWLL